MPGILKKAKRIVSMGGAFFMHGNVTPHAEFNYRYDPEAVDIVLKSGANFAIVPLDLTEQYVFGAEDIKNVTDALKNDSTKNFLEALVHFSTQSNM